MSPHNSGEDWGLAVRVRVWDRAGEATATLDWTSTGGRGDRPERPGSIAPTDTPRANPTDRDSARPDHDRRAAGAIRRYAVTNGCDRLLTLTLGAGTSDLRAVVPIVQDFQRSLREAYPDVAWVRAYERHESGDLHVHYALSRFVPQPHLQAMWPHGNVDIRRRFRGGTGTRPGREAARKAARYVSKYVVKDPVRLPGGHRYEVRQGRQPVDRVLWVDSQDTAHGLAIALSSLGHEPGYVWSSSGSPDWNGPPVTFSSW